MIQIIDIERFGCFKGFHWNNNVCDNSGRPGTFKRLNILYGRNYSGKTTLSRLIQSLELKVLPKRYTDPKFEIKFGSQRIGENDIADHTHDIRVFNRDFIDQHLSFLRDDDGKITPFAIVGSENKRIGKEIEDIKHKLGSVDSKVGLLYEQSLKQVAWQKAKEAAENAITDRKNRLTRKANKDIKPNAAIYGRVVSTYNITKIETDIRFIRDNSTRPLTEHDRDKYRSLVKQEHLPALTCPPAIELRLASIIEHATTLLCRRIQPTEPIQELLNDSVLQAWAKEGMALHRNSRSKCGFCGSPLPDDLWEQLDRHFSKEAKNFERELSQLLESINKEMVSVRDPISMDKSELYPELRDEYENLHFELKQSFEDYKDELRRISKMVKARVEDLFTPQVYSDPKDNTEDLHDLLDGFAMLTEKQRGRTETLSNDQQNAREQLRLNAVAEFIAEIDLDQIDKNITHLKEKETREQKAHQAVSQTVRELYLKIEELQKKLKDERRGAEKVNQYLAHFFGHESLRLNAKEVTNKESFMFEIRRGSERAYNLSDGECSLIAFCYFMARLEDTDTLGKDLIIYIDDPVSSLDNDHIFFVFGLIQSLIAIPELSTNGDKRDRYKQLFISTHNLEFLKFLKRLDRPKEGGTEHFLLIRTETGSTIQLMPRYLRQYVTELHYLFDQICACTEHSNTTEQHHCFFSFGNNMRRFLEVYLFFKYPFCSGSGDFNKRVERFFAGDSIAQQLSSRLIHEYSHGGEVGERCLQPIDHAEIRKVALHVLAKVKDIDEEQYHDLLQATERSDPTISIVTQGHL